MLSNASPAPNNNSRDYVNPAVDLQRKVGAPGSGFGSPVSRGPSVSSYRPLTRPNNGSNPATVNRGSVPPQNLNGKRPPLIDVTNANASPGADPGQPVPGPNEPKRPRVSDADSSGPRPPTQ
jgi:DNA repair and recombination protein RAD52